MSKKRKIIIGIILMILVIGIFLLISPFEKQNSEKNLEQTIEAPAKLRIGYRQHVFYAPIFVALEKELFNEYNIDVEAIPFESTNQMIEAMLANRIDASLGGVNTFVLFNIEEKSPRSLKIFSIANETNDNPLTYLLVKKDSDIKNVSDLEGKNIGSYLGSTVKTLYQRFITQNNLKNTSLSQMAPKLELQALETNQVDAIIAIEPTSTIGSQKNISKVLEKALFDKYFLKEIPLSASVMNKSLFEEQPDLARKLVAITEKAAQFIKGNPVETRQIIAKYTSLTEEIANETNIPIFKKLTSNEITKLNSLRQILIEEGEITDSANVENMILKR
jgi:NitT/TauT family transport system substrate-binding protein